MTISSALKSLNHIGNTIRLPLSLLNLAPNLQSRNRDQTSTKITRQNNLRYIKRNVSHRNPILVANLEVSFQLFEEFCVLLFINVYVTFST